MLNRVLLISALYFVINPMQGIAQDDASKGSVGELLYQIIETQGIEASVQKYRELKKQEPSEYDVSESALNALGYRLLQEDNAESAVAIFKLNSENHPGSINVWDSLAEGYFALGEKEQAEEYYQKVLTMLESDTTLSPSVQNFYRNNAEMQLFNVRNFDSPSSAEFHYASFYGGVPASRWDMQNLSAFKQQTEINLSYSGNNLYRSPVPNNIETVFEGTYPADVVHSFVGGDNRRFIEKGKIRDISSLWEKYGWEEVFPEAFKQMATVDGRQYFVPMAYQWNPIWYRKDIFEKHGLNPPETWEELLTLCTRLDELGYIPFTVSVEQWPPPLVRWFTIINLRLNGPDFHEQLMEGRIAYTDDRVRDVFEYWRELFEFKAFADSSHKNTYQTGIQEITSGKAVMYNLGEWIFESLDEEQSGKLDFFPFPKLNPEVAPAEIVHVYGAFITANSESSQNSEELLAWLAGVKSQQSNAEVNKRIVAHSEVDTLLYSDIQRRIVEQLATAEVLVPLFEVNTHPHFATAAFSILQEFWETRDINRAVNKLEAARTKVFDK